MSDSICKLGEMISIEQGEYSDYQVMGFFRVLKDFDPFEQAEIFSPCPYDVAPRNHRLDRGKFRAYLVEQGFLLEIEYRELYLGERSANMSLQ